MTMAKPKRKKCEVLRVVFFFLISGLISGGRADTNPRDSDQESDKESQLCSVVHVDWTSWLDKRTFGIERLRTVFNRLETLTQPEAKSRFPIRKGDPAVAVRLMSEVERGAILSAYRGSEPTSPIVENSRRALQVAISSEPVFDKVLEFVSAKNQKFFAEYMKAVGAARMTLILNSKVGKGTVHLDLFERMPGQSVMAINSRDGSGVARDPAALKRFLFSVSDFYSTWQISELEVRYIRALFSIRKSDFDELEFGAPHSLAAEILDLLGLEFNPFRKDVKFFVSGERKDGGPVVAKMIGAALRFLKSTFPSPNSFVYVGPEYIVTERKGFPSGWITMKEYKATWGKHGFSGTSGVDNPIGVINGVTVSHAASTAVEKVQSLNYHWDSNAEDFVKD
ncbi:MAG: hypothetical protein C5B49_15850 [Bdellovibrio sp.]|nr:MAG: hypothetical protein C5B49_15850 [Bdellovibrio sp.]